MKKYICPHCLGRFDYDNLWFKCEMPDNKCLESHEKIFINENGLSGFRLRSAIKKNADKIKEYRKKFGYKEEEPDEKIRANLGTGVFKFIDFKELRKLNGLTIPTQVKCPFCANSRVHTHICPTCKQPITIDTNETQFIINLAGARSSGKSAYLAALLYSIQKRLGDILNMWAIEFNDEAKKMLREYIACITAGEPYNHATAHEPQPVIVSFTKQSLEASKKYSFVFYDIPGEVLSETGEMRERLKHIKQFSYPDFIIYLCDPTQICEARKEVLHHSNLAEDTKGFFEEGDIHIGDRSEIPTNASLIFELRRLIKEITILYGSKEEAENADRQLKTPVAVCLTMFDELENTFTEEEKRSKGYFRKSTYLEDDRVKEYLQVDLDKLSAALRKQFVDWRERQFTNTIETNYGETRYFSVSAYGTNFTGLKEKKDDITPIVLDPLLWIMSKLSEDILNDNEQEVRRTSSTESYSFEDDDDENYM